MRVWSIGILLSSLVLSRPSMAGPAQLEDAAFKEHLGRADRDFQANHFRKSLAELDQAYALHPFPRLHYNMSQCYRQLGQQPEELKHLILLLETDPDVKNERDRKREVADRIAVLRQELGLNKPPALVIPVYKRWWFGTVIGGAAAGAAVGIAGAILVAQSGGTAPSPLAVTWSSLTTQVGTLGFRW